MPQQLDSFIVVHGSHRSHRGSEIVLEAFDFTRESVTCGSRRGTTKKRLDRIPYSGLVGADELSAGLRIITDRPNRLAVARSTSAP